jgi:SNF2 family DNA or RNA helicase
MDASDLYIPHLKTPLFPHQIQMVKAMKQHAFQMSQGFCYDKELVRGKLGIVADPNGTGKTLSVLAYIAIQEKLQPTLGELVPQSNRYFSSHQIPQRSDTSAVNVIIVPAHLLNQWTDEIATHMTRGFKALIIGNRRVLRTPSTMRQLGACDVIVTTNRVWPALYSWTQEHQIRWRNLFIDEAASIVLSVQDGIPAFDFLWLITGDWIAFQDRHSAIPLESSAFYRQIIPWTHPLRFLCVLKNTHAYPYPSVQKTQIVCRQQYTLLNLPPSVLGTNYDGLTHEKIPGLFQALSLPTWTPTGLNERYGRPDLLASKLEDDCSICLDTPQNSTILSCCMNHFCGSCILRQLIMSGQCPLCRITLALTDLHPIRQESSQNACLVTKHQATLDYIGQFQDRAILVYISYENIYYQLLPILANQGITCDLIESNVYRFNKAIENFNKGITKVLFISDLTMIRGLTLKADHLLFFSPPPSYAQEQMLVHSMVRLGERGPKQVVHLVTEETVEAVEGLMAVEAIQASP